MQFDVFGSVFFCVFGLRFFLSCRSFLHSVHVWRCYVLNARDDRDFVVSGRSGVIPLDETFEMGPAQLIGLPLNDNLLWSVAKSMHITRVVCGFCDVS